MRVPKCSLPIPKRFLRESDKIPNAVKSDETTATDARESRASWIDSSVRALFDSGCATLVGSASPDGKPHLVYGWGPRLSEDGRSLTVFVDRLRSEQTVSNCTGGRPMGVTVADVVSYRSVQVKGRCTAIGEADAVDREWVERHRAAFLTATALVGDPPGVVRRMWMQEVVRFDMTVEAAFNQTPGPEAGQPLWR